MKTVAHAGEVDRTPDADDTPISMMEAARIMGVNKSRVYLFANVGSKFGSEVVKLGVTVISARRIRTSRRRIAEYHEACSLARARMVDEREAAKLAGGAS